MGEKIKAYIKDKNYDTDVLNIALPDGYVEHGDVSLLRKKLEIDSDSVLKKVLDRYEKIKDEGEIGYTFGKARTCREQRKG